MKTRILPATGEREATPVDLIQISPLVTAIALPTGYGVLPLVLSFEQAGQWLGLGKTKLQQLVNRHELETAKVDGRTLILTRSAIALIERNLVAADG